MNNNNSRFLTKGKRADNSEWVCGAYFSCTVNDEVTDYILMTKTCDDYSITSSGLAEAIADIHPIISETRSQCTGIPDENGVPIFENDIVLVDGGFYKVTFTENTGFALYNGRNRPQLLQLYISQLAGIKVCGNIFDNAELMEINSLQG